jgi:hypothetical protein
LENHQNAYELKFEQGIASGLAIVDAAVAVAEAYLDGKPARRGKHTIRAADRNAAFWRCQFHWMLLADVYEPSPMYWRSHAIWDKKKRKRPPSTVSTG